MALSAFEKIGLEKYMQQTSFEDLYYLSMCKAINRKKDYLSYTDLLEFFTEYVLSFFGGKKKASIKNIIKYVYWVNTMLIWLKDSTIKVNDILMGKVRLINSEYKSYIKNNEDVIEDDLSTYILALQKTLNESFPLSNEEETMNYIKEINRLQDEVASLTKDADNQKKEHDILEKTCNEQAEKLKAMQQKATLSKNEAQTLQSENKALRKEIEKLNTNVSDLQAQSAKLKENVEFLTNASEVERQTQKEIDELLLSKLISKSATMEELVAFLRDNNHEGDAKTIHDSLLRLKKLVNVSKAIVGDDLVYDIAFPKIETDNIFNIKVKPGCACYDILLLGDMHILSFKMQLIEDYYKILNYCAENNVKLIIDVGDFFGFKKSFINDRLNGLTKCKKIVDETITKLPYYEGIYHALLGGNHDSLACNLGFDPIKMLTEERDDFISLGYNHAMVTFNGQRSILSNFMVHHINEKFPDPVMDDKYDNEKLLKVLNTYYASNNLSRDDSYIDILGHFHRSGLDMANSICRVPSLRYDRVNNGAWHLKVYLDEEAKIKHMVFMPLDVHSKILPITEIGYQKLVLK